MPSPLGLMATLVATWQVPWTNAKSSWTHGKPHGLVPSLLGLMASPWTSAKPPWARGKPHGLILTLSLEALMLIRIPSKGRHVPGHSNGPR